MSLAANLTSILALAAVNSLALLGARLLRRRYHFLPADKLAAFVIFVSIDVFVLLRVLLFDSSNCGINPKLACLFNNNRGVLAFGALVVAAMTVYVNARMKQAEEHRAENRRRAQALRMFKSAIDELTHNLQHFSFQIGNDLDFLVFPATTFEATFSLFDGAVISYLAPPLSSRLSTLQRIVTHNRTTLRSIAELDTSAKAIAILDSNGIVEASSIPNPTRWKLPIGARGGEKPKDSGLATESPEVQWGKLRLDERIITHSVRFLLEAAIYQPSDCGEELNSPPFRWLDKLREEMYRNHSYCYYHRSSELDAEGAADLRARSARLYCWIKDCDLEGIEIIAVRTSFLDLRHKPH